MANKALVNALKVLLCFDAHRPEWRVKDLAEATGLEKSHVVKILTEFVATKVLLQDARSRSYRVGPRAFSLGVGFIPTTPFARRAVYKMRRLTRDTGFTTTINTLDGQAVLHLQSISGPQSLEENWPMGMHIPWHATAAGKVHSAFIPEPDLNRVLSPEALVAVTPSTVRNPNTLRGQINQIRQKGYAQTYGESTPGMAAIAMPIFGNGVRFMGAISVLFPIQCAAPDQSALLRQLAEAAAKLSHELDSDSYPFTIGRH